MRLAMDLFPRHEKAVYEFIPRTDSITPFTQIELLAACCRLKNGESAGVDCITADIVKIVCMELGESCLSIFNECLPLGRFPECWKVTRLLLLPKSRTMESIKYLPITNTMGKVFEYMLQNRLR